MLVDVCTHSTVVVYNSEWTRRHYRLDLPDVRSEVIPIGIDFNIFAPSDKDNSGKIVFIGSSNEIKGFEKIERLVRKDPSRWILVMKDEDPGIAGTEVVVRATSSVVADILGKARLLVCPSHMETQHLAGCEAGASGVPVIATNVGIYSGMPQGEWGRVCDVEDFGEAIEAEMSLPLSYDRRLAIRNHWSKIVSRDSCRSAWIDLVRKVTSA
jgi:glycosyltransferase involved in cell wall biosynthesis